VSIARLSIIGIHRNLFYRPSEYLSTYGSKKELHSRKKKNKENIASVVTSAAWQKYHMKKQDEKLKKRKKRRKGRF
jgi:hypothetical protein